MKGVTKITRGTGTQHLHRESAAYRDAVRKKLHAYELPMQLGLIAQGLLQYLAVIAPRLVWHHFHG